MRYGSAAAMQGNRNNKCNQSYSSKIDCCIVSDVCFGRGRRALAKRWLDARQDNIAHMMRAGWLSRNKLNVGLYI